MKTVHCNIELKSKYLDNPELSKSWVEYDYQDIIFNSYSIYKALYDDESYKVNYIITTSPSSILITSSIIQLSLGFNSDHVDQDELKTISTTLHSTLQRSLCVVDEKYTVQLDLKTDKRHEARRNTKLENNLSSNSSNHSKSTHESNEPKKLGNKINFFESFFNREESSHQDVEESLNEIISMNSNQLEEFIIQAKTDDKEEFKRLESSKINDDKENNSTINSDSNKCENKLIKIESNNQNKMNEIYNEKIPLKSNKSKDKDKASCEYEIKINKSNYQKVEAIREVIYEDIAENQSNTSFVEKADKDINQYLIADHDEDINLDELKFKSHQKTMKKFDSLVTSSIKNLKKNRIMADEECKAEEFVKKKLQMDEQINEVPNSENKYNSVVEFDSKEIVEPYYCTNINEPIKSFIDSKFNVVYTKDKNETNIIKNNLKQTISIIESKSNKILGDEEYKNLYKTKSQYEDYKSKPRYSYEKMFDNIDKDLCMLYKNSNNVSWFDETAELLDVMYPDREKMISDKSLDLSLNVLQKCYIESKNELI